jgi:hypothetical protein
LPEQSRAVSLAQWDIARQLILTDDARKFGFGQIQEAKMAATIELVKTFQKVDDNIKPKDLYSNQYLSQLSVE